LSLVSGCSGVQKISNRATNIGETARSSQTRFETIEEEASKTELIDHSLIVSEASQGAKEQATIVKSVNDIIKTIPNIEDSVPWWATLMQYGFVAAAIFGVLALLWYLGLGYPIKALMRNFSSLIPSNKKSAARLLVKANDSESKTTVREMIAVLRATDPDFNAAYKKEKSK
tara:strand:+ start:3692 stop:4207 length:516 start_codon:yes stop_codon:yes gene_type:complete